jgi:uncharacterized protein (TIGR02453 family)
LRIIERMPSTFPGFSPKALSFFRQLQRNNKREWFQPRKETFENELRKPMIDLVEMINDDLRSFAADNVTEPSKAIYRIYRDTRFSKDKTPYKTHIAASFHRRGLPKHSGAGYYFSVSHKEVEVAAGTYMPGPEELGAVRRAIAKDSKTLIKLLSDRALRRTVGEIQGEKYARPPKGFESIAANNPAAGELLKHKQLYFYITLDAKLAMSSKLRREVVSRFRAMAPVVDWLNAAMLGAMRDVEDARPVRPAPMF